MSKALKNLSNRTIELTFKNVTERIPPRTIGKYHSDDEWADTFAQAQANEFISRREAKFVGDKVTSVHKQTKKQDKTNDKDAEKALLKKGEKNE